MSIVYVHLYVHPHPTARLCMCESHVNGHVSLFNDKTKCVGPLQVGKPIERQGFKVLQERKQQMETVDYAGTREAHGSSIPLSKPLQ